MNHLATLVSNSGSNLVVGYDFETSFAELIRSGGVDALIISSELGYSVLGAQASSLANELGMQESTLRKIAAWNHDREEVSLVGIPSPSAPVGLAGVVLAAGGRSRSYQRFAEPTFGKPYRDFYYNVAYESIDYAVSVLGATKIGMSHLTGGGSFREEVSLCVAEALGHFVDGAQSDRLKSFMFVGCCVTEEHLAGFGRLNQEGQTTRHIPINKESSTFQGYDVISLNWSEQ